MATKPWRPKIETDSNGNPIVPVLTVGRGIIGPEYFGCCGTGQRPTIRRIADGRYVVGTEYAADTLRPMLTGCMDKRIFRKGRETVWAFKSRKPAVDKFHELCGVVRKFNQDTREAAARDMAAAAKGDIGAALRLGDY